MKPVPTPCPEVPSAWYTSVVTFTTEGSTRSTTLATGSLPASIGSVEALRSPVAPSREPESPRDKEHALAETASTAASMIIVRFIEGVLPSEGTAFPRVIRPPTVEGSAERTLR